MGGSFRNTQASAIIRCAASSHHSKGYTSFPAFGVPLSITLCFLRYPLFKKDRLSDPLADIALATSACVPLFNSALFAFFRGYSIPPGVSCSITSPFTFHRSLFTSPLPFASLREFFDSYSRPFAVSHSTPETVLSAGHSIVYSSSTTFFSFGLRSIFQVSLPVSFSNSVGFGEIWP